MFRDNDEFKYYLAIVIIILTTVFFITASRGLSEEAYVICHPDDVVLVRSGPKKSYEATGELISGSMIHLDGKTKNGYCHCTDMANETGEGWVSHLYIVDTKPKFVNSKAKVVGKGRLAARRTINGERVKWLKPGSVLTVYVMTDEWCVTNYGYVKTEYLELTGDSP